MARIIIERCALAVVTLLGVSVLVFALVHIVPGDPVRIMLGDRATPESAAQIRGSLGLDDPLPQQYGRFLEGAVTGDLGTSVRTGRPVLTEIEERLPSTLVLGTAALALAIILGVLAGVAAAVWRRPAARGAVQGAILLGMATPSFCVGILLILIFSVGLGWFPVIDDGSLSALVLPTVALALPTATYLARMVRTTVAEALGEDYVRLARAKGVSERGVLFGHALRAGLMPIVTVVGVQFGALLTGAVVIEIIFSRPGIGRYAVTAIENRDFPQIQGIILVLAAVFVVVNLMVDLSYRILDPRTRLDTAVTGA